MRKQLLIAACAACLLPAAALSLPAAARAAAAEASPFDGTWKATDGHTVTYKIDGAWVDMKDSRGPSYEAAINGKAAPVKDDPAGRSVEVMLISSHTLEEVYTKGGNVAGMTKASVTPDGKTMDVTERDALTHKTSNWTATKEKK